MTCRGCPKQIIVQGRPCRLDLRDEINQSPSIVRRLRKKGVGKPTLRQEREEEEILPAFSSSDAASPCPKALLNQWHSGLTIRRKRQSLENELPGGSAALELFSETL